ncbi:MAG: hypothetical protein IPH80_14565 [Myxococcales bacterium]|nr:hypothetical protein [Myxococcales bacterium]
MTTTHKLTRAAHQAISVLCSLLLLSSAGCRDRVRLADDGHTAPPEADAVHVQPGPTQLPGNAPEDLERVASQPLHAARDHLAIAVLALLRAHVRLTALDAAKYALWISDTDEHIRRLLAMLCADRIALAGVDLDHTAIERLFPMEHVESAASITCVGLRLRDRIEETDLWAPRGQNGAPPTARVDAPPTPP